MTRNELLQQKKEKEEAIIRAVEEHKYLNSIKYDLFNEDKTRAGFVEYFTESDIFCVDLKYENTVKVIIKGTTLKSLRDILNKLLD